MLSRRSVRVKVMQLLYALNRDAGLTFSQAKKTYWDNIDKSFELLLFNTYCLINIARVSKEDFEKRNKKYLPTEDDKVFTPKLYENALVQSIRKNEKIQKTYSKYFFEAKVDKDLLRNIYADYSKEPGYKVFLESELTAESTLEVFLDLYRFCKKHEPYMTMQEDLYTNFEDDESVVIGAVKKILKALPNDTDMFFKEYYPDDETIKELGESLLIHTFENDAELAKIVEPTFSNWDSDRVAVIDMILIKMAVSEFLYFESIPTKVTLNEYVDLAKLYSTPKSNEFVNGVLDALLKSLTESGQIKKVGRGLEN